MIARLISQQKPHLIWHWRFATALGVLLVSAGIIALQARGASSLEQDGTNHSRAKGTATNQDAQHDDSRPQDADVIPTEGGENTHSAMTAAVDLRAGLAPEALATAVTISRDTFGVAHINGQTLEAAIFGHAYAQAEDFFWQIEDSYILGLGRYAEVHGQSGLNSDLLNRAFEVSRRAREEFALLDSEIQRICIAYVNGLNYFLKTHPEVTPRLIEHFEPWQVIAFGRQVVLETTFRYTRLHNEFVPRGNKEIWAGGGSNAWAIGPQKTASGGTILFANPHQPWFGFGQMCEVHLMCESEGINFIGAGIYGSPLPMLGHNQHLGWTLTTNEPDIADVWRESFDHPDEPLAYRRGDGHALAEEWSEVIRVSTFIGLRDYKRAFRKTLHGPVVEKIDEQTYLTANIAGLHETCRLRQLLAMLKARNRDEFEEALDLNDFPMMNVVYADAVGNIGYYYTGVVPKRNAEADFSQPLDGSDSIFDWTSAWHAPGDLPRLVNPTAGYVQNCNSSPFVTTSTDNPHRGEFPKYMMEDADDDRRRAKRSRQILDAATGLNLDEVCALAFDTKIHWAEEWIPKLPAMLDAVQAVDPAAAETARPLAEHLLNWDFRVTAASTQATLCEAWYFQMHASDSPVETMREEFANDARKQLAALVTAAALLKQHHGDWKTPWGDVFRSQRVSPTADFWMLGFDDNARSLPSVGVPGQMGAVLTQYYSPTVPIFGALRRYGVIGTSYMAVWEFGPWGVEGKNLVQFGVSDDPESPHFFDQAELLAAGQFKEEFFEPLDVKQAAVRTYHPGDGDLRETEDCGTTKSEEACVPNIATVLEFAVLEFIDLPFLRIALTVSPQGPRR